MIQYIKISIILFLCACDITRQPIKQVSAAALHNHENNQMHDFDYNPEPIENTRKSALHKSVDHTKRRLHQKLIGQNSEGNSETSPNGVSKYFNPDLKEEEIADKSESRRGLQIGLHMKLPTSKKPTSKIKQKKLEDALRRVLDTSLLDAIASDVSGLPSKRILKPAYSCDDWDPKFRMCVLERNLGDTVTFYLSTGSSKNTHKSNVTWKKECHIKNSRTRKEIVIDPDSSPNNIIIGRMGYELRVSPITETDIGYNLFSATLNGNTSPLQKLFFMVRMVPIDLGFVYVGETLEINLRSFVSLPAKSISFKWYMENDGEHGTLPSNMKVSTSGSSIKISELRKEQEGILDCSVYTNRNFFATKKRFLIKDLAKNEDVLKKGPDHNLTFKELIDRKRRYRQVPINRYRRDDLNEEIQNALMEDNTDKPTNATTKDNSVPYDKDYNLAIDVVRDNPSIQSRDDSPVLDYNDNVLQDINSLNYANSNLQNVASDTGLDSEVPPDIDIIPESRKPPPTALNEHGLPSESSPMRKGEKKSPSIDINIEAKGDNGENYFTDAPDNYSERKYITAEETIAKTISYCRNDIDCAMNAICIKVKAKQHPGFCKCLPGFNGVGIFCREDTWMSNGGAGIEDLQKPDVRSSEYPSRKGT